MELFLNELSIYPVSVDKYIARDKMKSFIQSVAKAKNNGFKKIFSDKYTYEIELASNYSLKDWFIDKEVSHDLKNFLFDFIVPPYINENDETIYSEYINSGYFFEDEEHNYAKSSCIGLAAAHLYESLTISFSSGQVWQRNQLPLIIEKGSESETVLKFNLFNKESFDDPSLSEFIENLGEVELIEATILPKDKAIHIADHHGQNELDTLSKRIRNSPYVVSIRSTNWGGKQFIRKVHNTGVIEIVLVNSQREYALLIQTTGRNYRETKEIANKLKDRYS
ncbi:hypothetical protein P700755_000877 [Psychroflexus torquis ATCC 700755]|uniref:Uncharacterized protein n=1 Tax=Psychroflexus torquis (strain ATCC 700755 / CIP 106069 / ACAM 623) TaxID=313595 RepID=K4IFJ5_PSYTT|nr:hypothetical protein [Psychroflexus torquis]AFU67856.1 hypothetical protein P700755_000877 [Psychroflexus torquis ATCC 700755]